ncbi:MAG: twin-arginine translocation signal domain-containing protein [Phocaeicola dorei]|nr:twin-arginine translocation signal domain-containing protein [Phocaeicola dorei]
MDESKGITRRQALKQMGAAAVVGAGLSIGSLNAADLLDERGYNGRRMKVLLVNGSPHLYRFVRDGGYTEHKWH